MKNLWTKTPAWLKAILLNILLVLPAAIPVQLLLISNIDYYPEIPWSFPLALVALGGIWLLAKRFAKFDQKEDVKLKLTFDVSKWSNWAYLIAVFLITPSVIQLAAYVFTIETSGQLEFIQTFTALEAATAIPLLLALAMSAGLIEEVAYRGFVQNTLTRAYPKWISFTLIGLIFALMHQLPLGLFVPYTFVSIAISLVADRTKSTGVVIWAHFLVDFASFSILYFEPFNLMTPSITNISIMLALLVIGLSCLILPSIAKRPNRSQLEFS